jgi:threonine aldolase
MASVAGVLPRVVETDDGILDWDRIEAAIRPKEYYRAQTALVTLENSHNMAGGTVYPTAVVEEICRGAHDRGLRVHLDGARVFNAAAALGASVESLTRACDSVQFCLSKGLGAPVGSLVVGERAFIESCRRYRKMLGGGMRQAGVLASAGLVALEDGPSRLQLDHDNARLLAERLSAIPGVRIDPGRVQTNIVIFGLAEGVSPQAFLEAMASRGILAIPVEGDRVRMVTHLDVSSGDVRRAAEAAREAIGDLMS